MNILTIFALISMLSALTSCASRSPTPRDQLLCRVEHKSEWENTLQDSDPYAIMEAYLKPDGTPCKTACRIRSPSNPALNRNLEEKNSPIYESCGTRKYCSNGECKTE